jgi:regulator of cell morphogenesis and NO signaling
MMTMRTKGEKIKFIEMPSAELVTYLIDIQHPYLAKAFSAFSLSGKTIASASSEEPGSRIMSDLIQKLVSLTGAHLEQDEKEFFACLGQLSLNRSVDKLPELLADIRKQHAAISRLFKKLRVLSNDYTAPQNASAMIRLCYAQLFNFEQDMMKHIFLEEDILFPKLLANNKHKRPGYGGV